MITKFATFNIFNSSTIWSSLKGFLELSPRSTTIQFRIADTTDTTLSLSFSLPLFLSLSFSLSFSFSVLHDMRLCGMESSEMKCLLRSPTGRERERGCDLWWTDSGAVVWRSCRWSKRYEVVVVVACFLFFFFSIRDLLQSVSAFLNNFSTFEFWFATTTSQERTSVSFDATQSSVFAFQPL